MAETDKPCSPWDPISPRGFSGREVGKTSGFPVLVNLLPGTDTSWRNTQADLPHCFSEKLSICGVLTSQSAWMRGFSILQWC